MKLSPRHWLLIFLLGGVGGALYDQIHVRGHVLAYPRDDLLQQSWWVAPNFGLAAVLIALTGGWVAKWAARQRKEQPPAVEIVLNFAWFTLAYLASAYLPLPPLAVLGVLAAAWLVRVLARPDRVPQLVQGVAMALAGTTFEATLSSTGAFHYLRPDLGFVPSWLPGLYLHAAPMALGLLMRLDPALPPPGVQNMTRAPENVTQP